MHNLDAAVLEATSELLVEHGYQGLTIAAISERSSTSKPSIYRRWKSKAHIVHEAVFPEDLRMPEPTADFEADIRSVVLGVVGAFATPPARAAIPGLLGEMEARPELQRELSSRFREPVWSWLEDRLEAAIHAGDARRGVEVQVLVETIVGSVVLATAFRGAAGIDGHWVDSVVVQLMSGIGRDAR